MALPYVVKSAGDTLDQGTLRSAIIYANTHPGTTITFAAQLAHQIITLSHELPLILGNGTIINGSGAPHLAISGDDKFRVFFVGDTADTISATIENLTISHALAKGGNGGNGGNGSGGGGAGLGGAIFVSDHASLAIAGIVLSGNTAEGGRGGGGGTAMGGGGQPGQFTNGLAGGDAGNVPGTTGGASGGGGGGGADTGPDGAGGGGGDGGDDGAGVNGGRGGFGGGGGGGAVLGNGGRGGFGGGGGGGTGIMGSQGGYGGGAGGGTGLAVAGFGGGESIAVSGGGGAGLGGAIFVMEGGSLTMRGAITIADSTVVAGTSAVPAGAGHAFGASLFLSGSGTVRFSPGLDQTEQIGDAIDDEAGVIADGYMAPLSFTPGSYGLIKSGRGTLVLSAGNAYAGPTTVTAGTLTINGSIVQSATTVDAHATLGGIGTTGNVTVLAAGSLAPGGVRAGILNTGNVVLDRHAHFVAEIGGANPGLHGYDQLDVTGAVNLTGAKLDLSLPARFHPHRHETFEIINNDGSDPVAGHFAGLAQGAHVTVGGKVFSISYAGGDGNDVVLTTIGSAPSHALHHVGAASAHELLLW